MSWVWLQCGAYGINARVKVAVAEVYNGGLELMKRWPDTIVHSWLTPSSPEAGRERFIASESTRWPPPATLHDAQRQSFGRLGTGRLSGVKLPGEVRIWAVEAGDVTTFREGLTPEVEAAVPVVVKEIMSELFPISACPRRLVQ